jgi:hypothetical protein
MATIILDKYTIRNNYYVDFYNDEYPDIKLTVGSSKTLPTAAGNYVRIAYNIPQTYG